MFLPLLGLSQNYVDLLKVGYGQTFTNEFDGYPDETQTKSLDIDLTFPVVLNDDNALVTGVLFSRNNVTFLPEIDSPDPAALYPELTNPRNVYTTILKLGLVTTFNEKWSGTFVVLPKLASDYQDISGDDFFMGGVALFKYQKKENLTYRFGWYAMGQAFGLFTTPIAGFYYMSPNKRFEMDVSLPVAVDVNYKFDKMAVGFDYFGIGRSFNLKTASAPAVYVDYGALEFAGYYQYGLLDNSVLLRAKIGYATNQFELYERSEKVDLRISAFNFGDDRRQINPDVSSGAFFKFEAIYRFKIPTKQSSEAN